MTIRQTRLGDVVTTRYELGAAGTYIEHVTVEFRPLLKLVDDGHGGHDLQPPKRRDTVRPS